MTLSFGAITILIFLFTGVAYYWFFRTKDEEYANQKNIIFDEKEENISEEGKS